MRITVYVEGPTDKDALPTLLRPVMDEASEARVGINFIHLGSKDAVMDKSPKKAANDLWAGKVDWVFALPDLYPMAPYSNTRSQHNSYPELKRLLNKRFAEEASSVGLDVVLLNRYRVHCLKHDLEGLILAVPEALRSRLGTKDKLTGRWKLPVEEQNDSTPPKRVVEQLFDHYPKRKYVDTTDAPVILGHKSVALDDVRKACRQNFDPFVSELLTLVRGGQLE